MVYKLFDQKTGSGVSVNEKLAGKLHKPVTKKFKRKRVVWYLLFVIDAFTKYACIKSVKDKKCKTVLNTFIEIVHKSNHKPNKLWVDQGREFCNKLMQVWLDNNNILRYSIHNEVTPVIDERFIKALKTKRTANDSKSHLILNK